VTGAISRSMPQDDLGQFAATLCCVISQRGLERIQIAVRINDFSRARESDAANQAGMIQRVRTARTLASTSTACRNSSR